MNLVNLFTSQVNELISFNIEELDFNACDCGAGPVDCCYPPSTKMDF